MEARFPSETLSEPYFTVSQGAPSTAGTPMCGVQLNQNSIKFSEHLDALENAAEIVILYGLGTEMLG